MDDEFLDYWETDQEASDDDFLISIYTLLPAAALLISLFLVILAIVLVKSNPDLDQHPDTQGNPSGAHLETGGSRHIAGFFAPSVRYWEADIVDWASEWGLDPNLVATVMQIESCGHPEVVSSAGAMGLFQVMPFHFKPGEASFEPSTNAYRGLAYLSRSLEAHRNDVFLALAGYNAGITGSRRPQSSWPAETVRYTYWGVGIYADAVENRSSSNRLDEWYASGGASLCSRANTHLGLAR